ncbi:hypothetical protein [Streptomyces brevispora]|uniref:hypothetical protein n=1 Tax=Streptomyces brevispora TaxID=887462 RepID=UPI0035DBDF04
MAEQRASEQLSGSDLVGMTPYQIDEARRAGRLDDFMAQVNTPTSHARPFTAPTDPATGAPVAQLGAGAVAAMSSGEIAAAAKAGKLAAYMAGHEVVPPSPDESAPAPVRAGFQFGERHVELMDTDEVAQYRAAGQLYDYDQAQAAGGAE